MSLADDLRAGLTRKIGPLPVWAWGATGVAGVLIVRRMRAKTDEGIPTASPGISGAASEPGAGYDVLPVDVTGGYTYSAYPTQIPEGSPVPTAPTSPVPTTVPTAPTKTCTKPTRKPDCKRWAPRCCPDGWHLAAKGPCAGSCVRNVG